MINKTTIRASKVMKFKNSFATYHSMVMILLNQYNRSCYRL